MKTWFKLLYFIFFFLAATGCSSNKEETSLFADSFEYITFRIENKDGSSVVLDRFEVINLATGEEIKNPLDTKPIGTFPVVSDDHMNALKYKETELQFRGYIDDILVVSETFFVSADDYHVFKIEGKDVVTLTTDLQEICTGNYETITLKAVYADENPVILDKFKVINTSTGEDFTLQNGIPSEENIQLGSYPVVDDGQKVFFGGDSSTEVQFIGYYKEQVLFTALFRVYGDPCHIHLMEGDNHIVVTP